MLNSLAIENVCIKSKPGNKNLSSIDKKTLHKIKKLYQMEYQKDLNIKIHISDEELNTHSVKTKNFIGQISTSIIECFSFDIPYYIYEPYNNGYDKKLFKTINLFEKNYINFNLDELKNDILKKKFLKIDKKKLIKKQKLIDLI